MMSISKSNKPRVKIWRKCLGLGNAAMIVASVPYQWCLKCRCPKKFVKIVLISTIISGILTVNFMYNEESNSKPTSENMTEILDSVKISDPTMTLQNEITPAFKSKVRYFEVKPQFPQLKPVEIQYLIDQYNEMQTVLNEDIYGRLHNDSLVIVVQVHNRMMYLRHTITSLAKARGIEDVLLILSHDYYDEEMNYYIQKLNFCKILQIFYPFSIQTHPNEFPGQSPNDCPPGISKEEAINMKCNNAKNPDSSGHYRTAKITQTKHHWWWKANRVFDQLNVTKNFKGLFVFIEEDHYVMPDFIHALKLMNRFRRSHCPNCSIMSLGNHNGVYSKDTFAKVEITQCISNLGLIFNRSVWEQLKRCSKTFCTYDDYNWDWTLQAVSAQCFSPRATTMILSGPRIKHIGECGLHHRNKCTNISGLRNIKKLISSTSAYQYPTQLSLQPTTVIDYANLITKNGGWGDIRDHNLCLNMTQQIN